MTDPKQSQLNRFKVDLKDYKILKEIQTDSHSSVYSIQDIHTKKHYAAKTIKNKNEKEIIKQFNNYSFNNVFVCQNPTLVKYYGYSTKDFDGNNNTTLIMDLMIDLPLSSFINKAQNGISNLTFKKERQMILLGIARGMMYLQEHHILLRYLNPSDIYLDENHHPHLINYGLLNNYKNSNINVKNLTYQEMIYIAPEILSNKHYNIKTNVYSFGIIMYELLTETTPFPLYKSGKITTKEFIEKISQEDFHPKFTTPLKKSFKKLIKRCLSKNPLERPSFDEIFNLLAYNMEDSLYDPNEDKDEDEDENNYYLKETNIDELFEYIDSITKNDMIAYEDSLNKTVEDLRRDNDLLKLDNEQMREHIELLKKQNVQLAKKFEELYLDHVVPLENSIEKQKKRNDRMNDKMKKVVSKIEVNRKESNLEISPPEEPKLESKKEEQEAKKTEELGTSWDDFEDMNKSDDEDKFTDSDEEKKIVKKRLTVKSKSNCKNIGLMKMSSKSDSEENYEVICPKSKLIERSTRFPHKKYLKAISKSDDDDNENDYNHNDFNETNISVDRFNALPLRFQKSFVSEYIKNAPQKFNGEMMLIKDLLDYLLKFHESINSIHYFTITTNESKESYKNTNEWCQDISEVHLLSASTEILYLNSSLDSSEFIELIKQFKSVSIEIKYPSENFSKTFKILSDIKDSFIKDLKIAVSISGIATSDDTFRKNKDITSVKLDSTVLYIGKNSFRDCSSLVFIKIPSSVQSIEYGAFRKCVSLKQISIPSSVTSIGEGSFSICTSLQKLILPNSINEIEQFAFAGCISLKEFTVPKSITTIPASCFSDCSSLTKIILPNSITKIESRAFHKCSSLKCIMLPSSIVSIGEGAFGGCSSLIEIEIPPKVTIIKKTTFAECTSLENVTIPQSVCSIEDQSFEGCFSLNVVKVPSSVTSLGFWAFPPNTVISSKDPKKLN